MMARDSRRSTTTALAFMATSMPPIEPPKMNMAMAASGTLGASATTSRPRLPHRPNQRSTVREPCFEIRWPHQVMAVTAPAPNSRISRPSVNFDDVEPGQEHRDLRRPAAGQEAVGEENGRDGPSSANGSLHGV